MESICSHLYLLIISLRNCSSESIGVGNHSLRFCPLLLGVWHCGYYDKEHLRRAWSPWKWNDVFGFQPCTFPGVTSLFRTSGAASSGSDRVHSLHQEPWPLALWLFLTSVLFYPLATPVTFWLLNCLSASCRPVQFFQHRYNCPFPVISVGFELFHPYPPPYWTLNCMLIVMRVCVRSVRMATFLHCWWEGALL